MKSQFHLPLTTYPDASSFTIVDNAIDLARQNDADLVVSIPQVRIPSIPEPFPTAINVDKWRGQAELHSQETGTCLREHLNDAAPKTGIQPRIHGFEVGEPFVYECFSQIARSHDLSIVEASELTRQLSVMLLFESGRPLILFPTTSVFGRVDTVAIAWDGGAAAARAICFARLFLERATKVHVISIIDDKEIDVANCALLVSSLKHSGFEVEDVSLQASGETTTSAIQSAAMERKADLLVAGGFGHSRLREFILGGVTRDILAKAELPVLLAH